MNSPSAGTHRFPMDNFLQPNPIRSQVVREVGDRSQPPIAKGRKVINGFKKMEIRE